MELFFAKIAESREIPISNTRDIIAIELDIKYIVSKCLPNEDPKAIRMCFATIVESLHR